MSDTNAIKWTGHGISLVALIAAVWWSGIYTAAPNWKLWFAVMGIATANGLAGFCGGYATCLKRYNIEKRIDPTNAGGHMFDPIHNGADECECGLVKSASVHY